MLFDRPGCRRPGGDVLCVESRLRELVEQGFEVAAVREVVPNHPQFGHGYPSAVVSCGFIANSVLTTGLAVRAMEATPVRR